MRSIRYILLGRPVTFEDCLHRAREMAPVRVEVQRERRDLIGDAPILTQLVASFTWHFPDRAVHCTKVCACIAYPPGRREAAGGPARADRRLRQLLEAVRAVGVIIQDRDRRTTWRQRLAG